MVNFDRLAAEIGPVVWGTQLISRGFASCSVILHGTPVMGVSETLRR